MCVCAHVCVYCVMSWQVKWEGSFIQWSVIAVTGTYDKREIGNKADTEAPLSWWWLGRKWPQRERHYQQVRPCWIAVILLEKVCQCGGGL